MRRIAAEAAMVIDQGIGGTPASLRQRAGRGHPSRSCPAAPIRYNARPLPLRRTVDQCVAPMPPRASQYNPRSWLRSSAG